MSFCTPISTSKKNPSENELLIGAPYFRAYIPRVPAPSLLGDAGLARPLRGPVLAPSTRSFSQDRKESPALTGGAFCCPNREAKMPYRGVVVQVVTADDAWQMVHDDGTPTGQPYFLSWEACEAEADRFNLAELEKGNLDD